jgi:Asp-tRNA(Asn)/Glu-tRNA(Gln) amidotransferase A subunit family amidase
MDTLLDAGLLPLAEALRKKEVSSEEITRATLARIDAETELGAFVELRPERSLAEARRKDAAKGDRPPFHGVPIGVKDLNFVRWWGTGMGSRGIPRVWSPMDDYTASRLRAGALTPLNGSHASMPATIAAKKTMEPRDPPPSATTDGPGQ